MTLTESTPITLTVSTRINRSNNNSHDGVIVLEIGGKTFTRVGGSYTEQIDSLEEAVQIAREVKSALGVERTIIDIPEVRVWRSSIADKEAKLKKEKEALQDKLEALGIGND